MRFQILCFTTSEKGEVPKEHEVDIISAENEMDAQERAFPLIKNYVAKNSIFTGFVEVTFTLRKFENVFNWRWSEPKGFTSY